MLQIKNVRKEYKTGELIQKALDGVSLTFRDNEFVAILGPSGSGKTTLLNIIGGLDCYDTGDLIINGISTKEYHDRDWDSYRNRKIGFIFQSYNLIPHQTILSNVELALTISGISRTERKERAKKALEAVGLGDQSHKKPNQMSGGQMQRVAIARALVIEPDIILADEPTGALDSETSIQIMQLLKEVAADKLVIMVTHNPELAEEYATQIIRLKDGLIIADSNPETDEENLHNAAKPQRTKLSFRTAWSQLVSDQSLRESQYKLLAGKWPTAYDEVALVVTENNEVSDFVLYTLGIMDTNRMNDIIEAVENDEEYEDPKENFQFKYVIGKEYQVFAPCEMYDKSGDAWIDKSDNQDFLASIFDNGITVKVTCVLQASDSAEISSGVAYDSQLIDHLMEVTENSDIVKAQIADSDTNVLTGETFETEDSSKEDTAASEINSVASNKDSANICASTYASSFKSDIDLSTSQRETAVSKINSATVTTTSYNRDARLLSTAAEESPSDNSDESTDSMNPNPSEVTYTVTFQNYDGTVLLEETAYTEGATTTNLPSEDPVRASSNTSEYIFIGWKSSATGGYYATADLPPVTENVTYTAMYYEQLLPTEGENSKEELPSQDESSFPTTGNMPDSNSTFKLPGNMKSSALANYAMPSMSAMNLSEDQLAVLMSQMSDSTPSTYEEVLSALGYMTADQPSTISLYPINFDSKEKVQSIIDDYNNQVKDEVDKVTYTDMIGILTSSITSIINTVSYILMAFVAISLIVSSIMIAIITYISVLERTKEIGVLRAIGASKNDVSKIFNAETVIEGLISGLLGIGVTLLLCIPINSIVSRMFDVETIASLPMSACIVLVAISVLLTLIVGFAPSRMAAKKDPVTTLRAE